MINEDLTNCGYAWTYTKISKVLFVLDTKHTALELRKQGVEAIEKLREKKISGVTIFIPQRFGFENSQHFIQSFLMWNYKFELKTEPGTNLLNYISLCFEEDLCEQSKSSLNFLITSVKSCLFTRDVQNTRANIATPEYMEEIIKVFTNYKISRLRLKAVTKLLMSLS